MLGSTFRESKYINFTLFTPKVPSLRVGVMKFTISCLPALEMLQTNLVKICPVVLQKKQNLTEKIENGGLHYLCF